MYLHFFVGATSLTYAFMVLAPGLVKPSSLGRDLLIHLHLTQAVPPHCFQLQPRQYDASPIHDCLCKLNL